MISFGGFGRSDVSGGVVLLCGKSSTTGDREVGGTEISGGASRVVVKLESESVIASLPRLGDARGGEAPPTSADLDVEASSPLLFAPNDVSKPPKGTGGYLDLDRRREAQSFLSFSELQGHHLTSWDLHRL